MSEHSGVDLVVVSPHLDDAALSVGGTLHALARSGCRVMVATVFTADEPVSLPSEVARKLQRLWGGERVMASRRREDELANAILGVGWRHLGLADALFRCAPNGGAHYQSLKALFQTPRRGDRAVASEVARALERLGPSLLLAPLGVGGHVDHRHARAGAEEVALTAGCPLVFYEDFPYAEAAWPRWRAHRRLMGGAVTLNERDVAARLAAIAAFRSQVGPLFGDTAKLERRVRRQLARRGGERLWAAPGTEGLRLLTGWAGAVA